MAGNSDVKKLVKELEEEIENGLELFKKYKEISNKFQEGRSILMNNEINKEFENKLKNDYNKELILLKEQHLKNELEKNYRKKLEKHRKDYKKMSEIYLVNSEKKFLKEKEKIRKIKKQVLSSINTVLSVLKDRMNDDDAFNKLLENIFKRSYKLSDKKRISFKTLMHHLESGEISEEVAKNTKKIDELTTIGNVVNRKKKMEIGIKQKEIQKLLENYEKTNKLSKESVKKEITKLVKSLNGISNAKKKEEVTTKIDRLSRSLKNEMTERERKIKYDIQIKTQELKELEKSL